MEDKEKIERLEKEIEELKDKKELRDKREELLSQRNRLKYPALYKSGEVLKRGWSNFADWAEVKNEQMEEDMKKEESKKEEPEEELDLEEELFGGNKEMNKAFGV